jgi:tripartite ATP-independent transporter DctM subunit
LGGLLGGACGSVTAISAGFATIISPELERYGYKKDFTIAIAADGGSLAAIVPPSIVIIIYGSITETSIGKLFMGSVIPGVLTTLAYIFILLIFEKFKKASITEVSRFQLDESTETIGRAFITSLFIILLIIVIIFGGIYSGIITATEAGGVASFIALIAMLGQRKLSLEDLKQAGTSTAKVTAMILIIVIGAQFFSRFLSLSMIPRKLIYILEPFMGHPYFVCFLLFMIIFFLGMILESSAVILMIVPIMLPIINALNVDNIWFGVVASFTIVLGVLTPPVGMAIYAACAASKTSMEGPFKFSFWFSLGAGAMVMPILFLFPETVTYLPRLVFG